MRTKLVAVLYFFTSICVCNGQKLFINNGVDTTDNDAKETIRFLNKYLSEFKGDSLPDFRKYWSKKDCDEHSCPDPIVYAIAGDYPTYSMSFNTTVLYIRPTADYTHVKLLLVNDVDSLKHIETLGISNHYLKYDANHHLYFIRPIDINTRDWKTTTIRNVKFIYPSGHVFNRASADSLIKNIQLLEKDWGLQPVNFTYYLADSHEDIQKMRGLDYSMDMGNRDKPSGMSDYRDSAVYCGGLGENYFHEVVHLYLNPKHPKSPLNEGLAVFYGGSMGHELKWHLPRLKKYLNGHPEIDLNKLSAFWYMDNYTNPGSAIQGLLCQLAYNKDGLAGLKRIMSYQSMEEVFKAEFGIAPNDWNVFLRKEIDRIQ